MADANKKSKIITPEFRGSYVNLVTPRAVAEGAEPKYSMLIVLPKDDAESKKFIKRLEAEIAEATAAKFNKPLPPAKLKHYPVKDGDAEDKEEFAGCWLVSTSNKFKPGVVDTAGNKLFESEDLYSGAWYRASISVWAWEHKTGGRGVSVNLNNVLKVRDDEAFTSTSKAEDDFSEHMGSSGTVGGEADDPMFA